MLKPKIGYWYTNCCYCDLQQIKTREDLKECLEFIEIGCIEGIWKTLNKAMIDLDKKGYVGDVKEGFLRREAKLS